MNSERLMVQMDGRFECVLDSLIKSFHSERYSCVCEVGTVSKISDCQPEVPGSTPAWSRVELWETFFHHIVRGQGR